MGLRCYLLFEGCSSALSVLQRRHTAVLMLLGTIPLVHTNVAAKRDFRETEKNPKVKIGDLMGSRDGAVVRALASQQYVPGSGLGGAVAS